jgi:transketolase
MGASMVRRLLRKGWVGSAMSDSGAIIGIRSFGMSAPGEVVKAHFGFDAAHVITAAKEQLAWHARLRKG